MFYDVFVKYFMNLILIYKYEVKMLLLFERNINVCFSPH